MPLVVIEYPLILLVLCMAAVAGVATGATNNVFFFGCRNQARHSQIIAIKMAQTSGFSNVIVHDVAPV